MPPFIRDLHLFADGREIAAGCPLRLEARESLTLRPALHHLEIRDLPPSPEALLARAKRVELRSGPSVLAFGEPLDCLTRTVAGRRITSLVFSPGLSLWTASLSLSLAAGMKVSDSLRAVLAACGAGVPLAAFAAEDRTLPRPQAFFGRACDALTTLAETADADVFLSPAGVCVSGRSPRDPVLILPEAALLCDPIPAGNRLIFSTSLLGWPLGAFVRISRGGRAWTGRLVSRLLQADNRDGPWRSELEMVH